MKRIGALVLVLAVVACKKDATDGMGSAGDIAPPAPAKPRPSQMKEAVRPMPALELPADEKRAEKIALGHTLFFDARLSGATDRSCYSCHQNEDGTGGHDPIAIGSGDKKLTRHAPSIWNVGYWNNAFYWDGRAKTLEANVQGAWGGGNMGGAPAGATPEATVAALDARTAELIKIPAYKAAFEAAFPGVAPKAEQAIAAIAEYMRSLVCTDTAYDKFANGDQTALSEPQQRGFDLFVTKGRCNMCHSPPFFSTAMSVEGGAYFNVGIGTKDVPVDQVDIGRKKVTNVEGDWAAFKPPSLRNVRKSPPYFHDGSVATLDEAVKLMASGGIDNPHKTPLLVDAQLTDAERADIVAFLGALDCGSLEKPTVP